MSDVLRHTIGDTAKLVGVSTATLRLWEQVGFISPQRSRSGHRFYNDEDILRLRQIQSLRKDNGLNFAAIRRELGLPEQPKTETTILSSTDEALILGRKLRFYRHKQKLTLKQVSRQSGLSVSFVSAVERGATGISLASLLKLSLSYNIHLSDLYGESSSNNQKLVRTTDRQIFEQDLAGVRIEQLTHGPSLMEAQRFILEPGASSDGSYSHGGEEIIYVLEGSVDFYLDEIEHHHLDAGDCLHFSSLQLHRWENEAAARACLLWVDTSTPLEWGEKGMFLSKKEKSKQKNERRSHPKFS
jgi:DNA-binding transcriptional MerR regulator/quercetin dioxygenase-like cupin family protein